MISPSEPQKPLSVDMSQLLIRRMRADDVAGVMAIESVSFGKHHWSEESFLNEMKNQIGRYSSLVNTQTEEVLGYCGYWIIFDEAHVTTVAVKPNYRGNALGEVLLVYILNKAMGQSVKWVTLEVRASNYSAQNLYYKYGFRSMGLRPRYYQDNGEDALIMTTPDINTGEYRALFNENKTKLAHRLRQLPEGIE